MKRVVEEMSAGGEPHQMTLLDWMVHDWVGPKLRRTVREEFLNRRGPHLTEHEREMAQGWSGTYVGFYEVQALQPGTGLTLRNLMTGETLFAHDVSASKALSRWDALLARVITGKRGLELTGAIQSLPRAYIEPLCAWLKQERETAGIPWPEYSKKNRAGVRREALAMGRDLIAPPRLANTDGDELLISRAVYKMLDKDAVSAALNHWPGMSPGQESGQFTWMNEKKTILGNIQTGLNELALECNSRERLDRSTQFLADLAPGSLPHLRHEFTTQKKLMRQVKENPRPGPLPKSDIPQEVKDALVRRYLADHYRKWPDEHLPALGGKTTKQAVQTPEGRDQVTALLKDFENREDHKPQDQPRFDFAPLRAELGLDR